ncbi:MAG: hypothetical protein ACRDMI_11010 [Streptosporangiaceae bacterium]
MPPLIVHRSAWFRARHPVLLGPRIEETVVDLTQCAATVGRSRDQTPQLHGLHSVAMGVVAFRLG